MVSVKSYLLAHTGLGFSPGLLLVILWEGPQAPLRVKPQTLLFPRSLFLTPMPYFLFLHESLGL